MKEAESEKTKVESSNCKTNVNKASWFSLFAFRLKKFFSFGFSVFTFQLICYQNHHTCQPAW